MTSTPNSPMRIAIIGNGPSGATTACLLARKGHSTVIFDDGARPALVVGESLVPQLVPVFRRLGIEDEVAKLGVKKPGVTVTFGPVDEVILSFIAVRGVLPTYAYNVPRKEFDQLIADTAVAAGTKVINASAKLEIDDSKPHAEGPALKLTPETLALVPEWGGKQPDFIIDASGRRRIFAKLLSVGASIGPRKDVAHFAHYENCPWPEPHGQVWTMRLEYGWGWRIPLPGPRTSLGVVINKEDAKKFGSTPEEQLEGIISNDHRLKTECGERRRVSPVATYTNYQLISDRGFGPNWAMVGDAFGFVDPMLSPGLCMAMVSAEKLADSIIPGADGSKAQMKKLDEYIEWFRLNLSAWQDLVNYFYDGRIFAIHSNGMKMQSKHPGFINDIVRRHVEKNLSGMASGAYIARPYSRWLLRTLIKHFMADENPANYAIR